MTDKLLTCFALMPYGEQHEYEGGINESDFIFRHIIQNGIELAEKSLNEKISLIREIDRRMSGAITKSVIRYLARADIVVVDITGNNPNIFLQLGIRYALCKRLTILLAQEETSIPFDISSYILIKYNKYKPELASAHIAEYIVEMMSHYKSDSPVYDVFPRLVVNGVESQNDSSSNFKKAKDRKASLFISYSNKDDAFAKKLHADLTDLGIQCWFAPEDIKGGKKIYEQLDEAIHRHDRLLLILSHNSINSNWVEFEIRNARQREIQQKRKILFPISITDYNTLKMWKLINADEGRDLAAEVREYYMPDFSKWNDEGLYKLAFDRLVRDLDVEE